MFIFTAFLCADEGEGGIKKWGVRALDAEGGVRCGLLGMNEKIQKG